METPSKECPICTFFELPSETNYVGWSENILPLMREDYKRRKQQKEDLCTTKTIPTNVENWVWPNQAEYDSIAGSIAATQNILQSQDKILGERQIEFENLKIQFEKIQSAINEMRKQKELNNTKLELEKRQLDTLAKRRQAEMIRSKTITKSPNLNYCNFLEQLLRAENTFINQAPKAKVYQKTLKESKPPTKYATVQTPYTSLSTANRNLSLPSGTKIETTPIRENM